MRNPNTKGKFTGKGKSKPNVGRPNTRKPKLEKDESTSKVGNLKDDINDSSYYYNDPILRDQITNFSFNQFTGIPFNVAADDVTTATEKDVDAYQSTIMSIELSPNAGAAIANGKNVTNGVRLAGQKNYYMLSASNAKTTNYAPQDVTMLILALTSVIELQSYLQRVIGTPYIYNIRNRTLPKQLLATQLIDSADLVANMADYRIRFNTILQRINKIPFPAGVKAFIKSASLYSNYYVDDTSPMASFYVMKPYSWWLFDEANAKLVTVYTPSTPQTFGTWLGYLEACINAILESSTFNYIFSDILRLNEKEGLALKEYQLIPDGYLAPILYSNEFNLWVDNMAWYRHPLGTDTAYGTKENDVTQDINNNTLFYAPYRSHVVSDPYQKDFILDFDINNPDVESKVASTRLITGTTIDEPVTGTYIRRYFGSSHFVNRVMVSTGTDANGDPIWMNISTNVQSWTSVGFTYSIFTAQMTVLAALSQFKHAPKFLNYDHDSTDPVIRGWLLGDLDYYTTVDSDYLTRMFDTEFLTYFTIG